VGQGCRCRFIDDAFHIQTSNLSGVLRRLALRVIEIGGNGDDRLAHALTQVVLSRFLQLLQDLGRYLGWRDLLVTHLKPDVAVLAADELVRHTALIITHLINTVTNEPLRRVNRVLWIRDGLALRDSPYENLTLVVPGHY